MKKKLKKWQKVLCSVLAAAVLVVGGFMGVDRFMPKERSLTIIDEATVTTSQSTAVETAADENTENLSRVGNSESTNNELKIDAKAAALIDGTSGKVLFAQNEKEHLPPASVTKVMTLLLVLEAYDAGKIALKDEVTISENAASMGGSQMYMEPGETHTVEELLKGVIMASANDGCVALAEHLYGTVEEFVDQMNRRAQELGLTDSHFVNTNGLPVANHYSCAYDIGMISAELMKHEVAHEWFTTWQEDIQVGLPGKEKKFTLTNTNKFIRSYNGAMGIKTGFTEDAMYCLSGAAQRGNTKLIGVVLGCKTSAIRFAQMAKMMDYGFANYETVKLADKGACVKELTVEKGEDTKLYAITEEAIGLTVHKGNKGNVKRKIMIDKNIKLPVKKGDAVGSMTVYEGKEKAAEYDLVSDRNVEKADYMTTYIRMMKKLI